MANEAGKKTLEIVLMPLAIAFVGMLSTAAITYIQNDNATKLQDAQIESAEKLAEAQRNSARDRYTTESRLKIIEILREDLVSEDTKKIQLALSFINAVDPKLRVQILSAIKERIPDREPITAEFRRVSETATLDRISQLISELESSNKEIRRESRSELAGAYDPQNPEELTRVLFSAIQQPNSSYRLQLGVSEVLRRIHGKWQATREQLSILNKLQKSSEYKNDPTFKKSIEGAIQNAKPS